MSEVVDNENKVSSRRRSPRRRGPRKDQKKKEVTVEGEKPTGGIKREMRDSAPRPVSLPIPSEMVDKPITGNITAIIKRGRLKFGFIHLGEVSEIDEDAPRVYFSFAELTDEKITLRKGYHVQFICKVDDKDRQYAAGITLTEAGVKLAAQREDEIEKNRSVRVAPSDKVERSERPERAERERKPRERKERKPVEEKNVTLMVKCVGYDEMKEITFNVNESLGRLKNVATSAFGAPISYNVYYDNVFLSKSILLELGDKAVIHLAAPKEDAAIVA
jgi:hypothetical protein